jgi:predicted nucleic acid-binding protein
VIVVDASALLETLLLTSASKAVEERLFAPHQTLHAPHLVDVEVAQVIRRYAAHGEIDSDRGRFALADLAGLPLRRYFKRQSGPQKGDAVSQILPATSQARGGLS